MKKFLIIFILLLSSAVCEAKSLYVNNSGTPTCSDATTYANNTSAAPWCTVLRAVRGNSDGNRNTAGVSAQAAQAGDTVYITAGIYNYTGASFNQSGFGERGLYDPINSGSEGAWITFQAVGGVVELPGNTGGLANQITTYNSTHIKWIGGFKIVQADIGYQGGNSIVTVRTSNVWLENFEIVGEYINTGGDNHAGIMTHGPRDGDCLAGAIENITIRNNKIYGFTGTTNNDTGITIYCTGQVTIENNEIYSNTTGIYGKSSYIDNSTPSYIRKNLIYNNAQPGIYTQAFNNYRIYQNIIRDNNACWRQNASREGVSPGETQPNNMYFINNICDGNTYGIYVQGSTNCVDYNTNFVQNNIVTNTTNAIFAQDPQCGTTGNMGPDDISFNYNAWEYTGTFFDIGSNVTLATFISSYGQGSSQWNNVDPLYTNEAGNVFTLQAGSPCKAGQANDGVDILQLLGGLATAEINLGAYVSAGQTEVIGIDTGTAPTTPSGITVIYD